MNELSQDDLEKWADYVTSLAHSPCFVTVSGAHLYGFSSPDSDIDLRGCHQLALNKIVGLQMPKETFQVETIHAGTEVDLVSHDVGKYFRLLCKNNGYVLEQIFSPLVVTGDDFLRRLRPLAQACITRNHFFHYRGFYKTQRKLIEKMKPVTAKAVLYAYRVLLTGINLMQTGMVEANLRVLNQRFQLPGIDELIASKLTEKAAFDFDWGEHANRLDKLERDLEKAYESSTISKYPNRDAVNSFLIQLRLGKE